MTLRVRRGESPAGRMDFSRGLPLAGAPHGGVSHGGVLHVGRDGPREAYNYLSMATGRWGRPLGNLADESTWKKDA